MHASLLAPFHTFLCRSSYRIRQYNHLPNAKFRFTPPITLILYPIRPKSQMSFVTLVLAGGTPRQRTHQLAAQHTTIRLIIPPHRDVPTRIHIWRMLPRHPQVIFGTIRPYCEMSRFGPIS